MSPFFRFSIFLTFCVCSVRSENDTEHFPVKIDGEAEAEKQNLAFRVAEIQSAGKLSQLVLESTENKSDLIEISAIQNFTDEDNFELLNATAQPGRSVSQNFTVRKWTLLQCRNDESSWVCELQSHMIMEELGIRDTFSFVIGGRKKLRVGYTEGSVESERPSGNLSISITFRCYKTCQFGCPDSGFGFSSFWFGFLVGVICGVLFLAMLAQFVSVDQSEETMPVEIQRRKVELSTNVSGDEAARPKTAKVPQLTKKNVERSESTKSSKASSPS